MCVLKCVFRDLNEIKRIFIYIFWFLDGFRKLVVVYCNFEF